MDQAERHQIANRIHVALQRHFGAGIDVAAMLARPDYAREVMYVCQGLDDAELRQLAGDFERASAHRPKPMPVPSGNVPVLTQQAGPAIPRAPGFAPRSPGAAAPQDAAWSRDSSGFGVTQTAEWHDEDSTPPRGSRLRIGNWFRRESR